MVVSAQDRCNTVLDHVRSSNLNFLSQETSYSVYLTIRKSFVKNSPNCYPSNPYRDQTDSSFTEPKNVSEAEINRLKMKLSKMEAENAILTKAYEDEVEVSTNLKKQLDDADDKLDNIHINFRQLEASLDNLNNAKK